MSTDKFLCDKHAPPFLVDGAWTLYMDNIIRLYHDQLWTIHGLGQLKDALHPHQLSTHDELSGVTDAEILGWKVDGVEKTIGPTSSRAWRVLWQWNMY